MNAVRRLMLGLAGFWGESSNHLRTNFHYRAATAVHFRRHHSSAEAKSCEVRHLIALQHRKLPLDLHRGRYHSLERLRSFGDDGHRRRTSANHGNRTVIASNRPVGKGCRTKVFVVSPCGCSPDWLVFWLAYSRLLLCAFHQTPSLALHLSVCPWRFGVALFVLCDLRPIIQDGRSALAGGDHD